VYILTVFKAGIQQISILKHFKFSRLTLAKFIMKEPQLWFRNCILWIKVNNFNLSWYLHTTISQFTSKCWYYIIWNIKYNTQIKIKNSQCCYSVFSFWILNLNSKIWKSWKRRHSNDMNDVLTCNCSCLFLFQTIWLPVTYTKIRDSTLLVPSLTWDLPLSTTQFLHLWPSKMDFTCTSGTPLQAWRVCFRNS
jgi:hypothetical protein